MPLRKGGAGQGQGLGTQPGCPHPHSLTCGDAGCLGVVAILDAGDELAAVLQRVPTHQGRLAPPTLGHTKAGGIGTGSEALGCGDPLWGC